MQYVAGTTLERVIEELSQAGRGRRERPATYWRPWTTSTEHTGAVDPAGLRDREALAGLRLHRGASAGSAARLAEALAHAHDRGVLHRDVKPANILLNRYGRPLLADFNIARDATRDGRAGPLGGTPGVHGPRAPRRLQLRAPGPVAVGRRSDVYSLGLVLFEMLTGRRPVADTSSLTTLAAIRRKVPPSPEGVPPVVAHVVARCLDPDPEQRPAVRRGPRRVAGWLWAVARSGAETAAGRAADPCSLTDVRCSWGFSCRCLPHLLGAAVGTCYATVCVAATLEDGLGQRSVLLLLLAYGGSSSRSPAGRRGG